jgi:uncharacterized protein YeaO (DUF488 family)
MLRSAARAAGLVPKGISKAPPTEYWNALMDFARSPENKKIVATAQAAAMQAQRHKEEIEAAFPIGKGEPDWSAPQYKALKPDMLAKYQELWAKTVPTLDKLQTLADAKKADFAKIKADYKAEVAEMNTRAKAKLVELAAQEEKLNVVWKKIEEGTLTVKDVLDEDPELREQIEKDLAEFNWDFEQYGGGAWKASKTAKAE